MDPEVSEWANNSTQEYNQCTYMMGRSRGSQDSKGKWGQISSTAVCSIFSDHRVQLNQYWKEEGFGYIDQTLLMCKIMDPSTYRSLCLEYEGSRR